jgi:hypothetical protein
VCRWCGSDLRPVQFPRTAVQVAPVVVGIRQSKTSGLAIAALVLGILWLWWVGSILALVFGYVAKGQIERSAGQLDGRVMAIAGIVLGWVGIAGFLILLIEYYTT